jgi:hypothetical protein
MQKVVGSSPIIRFTNRCKSAVCVCRLAARVPSESPMSGFLVSRKPRRGDAKRSWVAYRIHRRDCLGQVVRRPLRRHNETPLPWTCRCTRCSRGSSTTRPSPCARSAPSTGSTTSRGSIATRCRPVRGTGRPLAQRELSPVLVGRPGPKMRRSPRPQVVDARFAAAHEPVLAELPELVAVAAPPVAVASTTSSASSARRGSTRSRRSRTTSCSPISASTFSGCRGRTRRASD